MSATVAIDPALRRLLDNLPIGDPDAPLPVPDWVEVWIDECDGRHMRPLGVPTTIHFGFWGGPPIPSVDVVIHVRNVRTGRRISVRVGQLRGKWPPIVDATCPIIATNSRWCA